MAAFEIVPRHKTRGIESRKFKIPYGCANGCLQQGGTAKGRQAASGRNIVRVLGIPAVGFCDRCAPGIEKTLREEGAVGFNGTGSL